MFEVKYGSVSGIFDDPEAAARFAKAIKARESFRRRWGLRANEPQILQISDQDWLNRKAGAPTKAEVDESCHRWDVMLRIIAICKKLYG